MTMMLASETRLNLILSLGLTVLGLLTWLVGLLAVVQGFLLPDYATVTQGCGGLFVLLGMLWGMLTSLRVEAALPNLITASILSVITLVIWLTGSWLASGYALPLSEGGRNTLIVCLLWLLLSVGKLIVSTPTVRSTR